MIKYITKKILQMIPLLLAVIVIAFFVVRLIPGDPVALMLGKGASVEAIEHAREQLGYNDPLPQQLIRYIGSVLKGDLGTSLRSGEDIFEAIMRVFPVTLKLAVFSTIFSTFFGVILGVVSAVRRDKFADGLVRVMTLISISMPSFFLGLVFIIAFSLILQLEALHYAGDFPGDDGARLYCPHHPLLHAGCVGPGLHPYRAGKGAA